MNELRNILEDSIQRLFTDRIDGDCLTRAEQGEWPAALWSAVTDLGVVQVLDETTPGDADPWLDAYAVARACGRHGVPLPICEAILAHWLARRAEIALPDGVPGLLPRTLDASEVDGDAARAQVRRIPWGRAADFFIGLAATASGCEVVLTTNESTVEATDENLAREPRDTVTFDRTPITARGPIALPAQAVRWLGALFRSAQIAGAGTACLELAVRYTSEREQFGRPLAKFQAIQHQLAQLASAVASVDAVTMAAFHAMGKRGLDGSERDARLEIAAAKCRASEAVETLTRIGHQVHGAFGFTHEYRLHFATRRLWSWRAEFGGSGEWGEYLGRLALQAGGDQIWATITR